MNIVQKYIFRTQLKMLVLSTCIFLFISLLTRIIHYGELVSSASVKLYDIFRVMLLVQPKIIFSLLPFTFLISCFITYNSLISSNEHTSIYNTGKGNFYLISPFFSLAAPLFFILLLLSNYIIPKAYIKIENIQEKIALGISSNLIKPKEFTEHNGILLFIYKANEGKTLSNILLADRRNSQENLFLVANEGIIGFNGSEATLDSSETYLKKYTSYTSFPMLFSFENHFISINLGKKLSIRSSSFLSYESTFSLLQKLNNNNEHAIRELQMRIGWPFFIFLIPLSAITCLLYFFNFNRNKISLLSITLSGAIIFYIIFSAVYSDRIFNFGKASFLLYYLNIILIFTVLLFMCRGKR